MSKERICILGAGITGLSLAFYLQQSRDADITIIEKAPRAGGWIRTDHEDGFLFERGPRSIRATGDIVPKLVRSLNLQSELIEPSSAAKQRYLWHNQELQKLPRGPKSLLFNSLLKGLRRSILGERTIYPTEESDESVYAFFRRRFGERFTERLVDPVISGIYAGNPHTLSMRSCFPKLWAAEQKYGSLIKGMRQMKTKPHLFSFKNGLETLPRRLVDRVKGDILLSTEVTELVHHSDRIEVITSTGSVTADKVYSTLPASALTKIIPSFTSDLPYAGVVSVGLGYHNLVLKDEGFGYLIASKENEDILGAVFDSLVFPQQNATKRRTRITVMMGGARRPDLLDASDDQLGELAQSALERHLGLEVKAATVSIHRAQNAIPQYPVGFHSLNEKFKAEVKKEMPHLTLLGTSFHDGVSIQDCVTAAKEAALA